MSQKNGLWYLMEQYAISGGSLISFASNNVWNLTNVSGYTVERTILSKASLVATYGKVV